MSASRAPLATKDARGRWLFGAKVDLAVFLGSALLAFALLGVGALTGVLCDGTPDWAWVPAVLLVDVAHVWATGFRVYFDRDALARRPLLYGLVPLIGFASSVALYSRGADVFWQSLAYLAIFHFVRQQYGWVALYRARCGEEGRAGRWLDAATVYAATLYPLVYWHAHLPRHFDWFVPGDLAALPSGLAWVERACRPIYTSLLVAYAVRAAIAYRKGRGNPGKDIVVATTAACWYVGIVLFDSDYAFTVTNVFIHGVPYFALVYFTRRMAHANANMTAARAEGRAGWFFEGSTLAVVVRFLGVLWVIAFAEELLWDRAVWQEHAWLFGPAWALDPAAKGFIVPLLALPQLTHYVLDGFIWRRRSDPALARQLALTRAPG